jgi:hypothetical protein
MNNETKIHYLRAVKERLFEKGWRKGHAGDPHGPNCILGAIYQVVNNSTSQYKSVVDALGQYESVVDALGHTSNIINFNDSEETTFDDILDFIDSATKKLEMGR